MHPNEIMIAELNISSGCATCCQKIIVSNVSVMANETTDIQIIRITYGYLMVDGCICEYYVPFA